MATYTSNKNIIKPTNGEYPDAWDVPINTDWDIIDKALGSAVQKTLSNVDITLTVAEAANQQIYLSGALTGPVTVIIPFQTGSSTTAVGGEWIVYNNTTGVYSVSMVTQKAGSTGVVIPQSFRCKVYSDQANIAFSDDMRFAIGTGLTITGGAPPVVSLSAPVLASLGGTGKTANTANSVLLGNGTGALLEVAPGNSGNVLTSNGTTWTSQAPSGGGGGGGITSFTIDGGVTGLLFKSSGSSYTVPTDGTTPSLQGTLSVANGGTGNTSFTGYLKGNGTASVTATTSIPGSDISGAVATATTATTATTAATATNVSGGTVNATTGAFSGAVTVFSLQATSPGSGAGGNGAIFSTSGAIKGLLGGAVGWTGASVVGASNTDWGVEATETSYSATGNGALICRVNNTSNALAAWFSGTTPVGYVGTNGSGTIYGTSSDYRLKENVQNLSASIDLLKSIHPVSYTWIGNPAAGVDAGFIAHELQAFIPQAVIGEKDALRNDGSIAAQQIDYSKLVPYLVAWVQTLQAEIETLKDRLP
jgi:hypothetical protein